MTVVGSSPTAEAASPGWPRWASWGLYLAVMAVGLTNMFWPTLSSGFACLQSDAGDPRFNHYLLEHSYRALFEGAAYPWSLWSPPFFFPQPNTLFYSDTLLGTAPIYWALRLLAPPDLAYSLWTMVALALTFVAMVYLLRRVGAGPLLAALGALLFAFCLPRNVELTHPQLLSQFYTPLALLWTWRFIRAPSTFALAAALSLCWLQLLAGFYLGWFLLLGLAVFVALVYLGDAPCRRRLWAFARGNRLQLVGIIIVWLAAIWLQFAPYYEVYRQVGGQHIEGILGTVPGVENWFAAPQGSLFEPHLALKEGRPPELDRSCLFAGFTLLAMGLAAVVGLLVCRRLSPTRRLLARSALLTTALLVVLSLRYPQDRLLWWLVADGVPGGGALRFVHRIWTVVYFFLILGAGATLGAVRSTRTWRRFALGLLGVLALAVGATEQLRLTSPHFCPAAINAPQLEMERLMLGCDVAYVKVEPWHNPFLFQVRAMWAGLRSGVPVVNGYTGKMPKSFPGLTIPLEPQTVRSWVARDVGPSTPVSGTLCYILKRRPPGVQPWEEVHNRETVHQPWVRRLVPLAESPNSGRTLRMGGGR